MRGRRLLQFGLICVASGLVLAGCGDTDDNTLPGPNMLDDVETEVVASIVMDDDGAFSEEVVDVDLGQAIEFTNEADHPQRLTGSREDDQIYDTGDLLPAESTIIAFDTAGRYTFEIEDSIAEPLRVAAGVGPTEESPVTEAGNR